MSIMDIKISLYVPGINKNILKIGLRIITYTILMLLLIIAMVMAQ